MTNFYFTSADLPQKKFDFRLNLPSLFAKGKYDLNMNLFLLRIFGKGDFNMTLSEEPFETITCINLFLSIFLQFQLTPWQTLPLSIS